MHKIRDMKAIKQNLEQVAFYLREAIEVAEGAGLRRLPRSEINLCLLWAHFQEEREALGITSGESGLTLLRSLIDEVRNKEAMVDTKGRKVYHKEAGRITDLAVDKKEKNKREKN